MFIIIVFWLGCDRPSWLPFFRAPYGFLHIYFTPLFLPTSSVSVSYLIIAAPMRECLWKHSCMSFQFPVAVLSDAVFFALWKQWITGSGELLNWFYYTKIMIFCVFLVMVIDFIGSFARKALLTCGLVVILMILKCFNKRVWVWV